MYVCQNMPCSTASQVRTSRPCSPNHHELSLIAKKSSVSMCHIVPPPSDSHLNVLHLPVWPIPRKRPSLKAKPPSCTVITGSCWYKNRYCELSHEVSCHTCLVIINITYCPLRSPIHKVLLVSTLPGNKQQIWLTLPTSHPPFALPGHLRYHKGSVAWFLRRQLPAKKFPHGERPDMLYGTCDLSPKNLLKRLHRMWGVLENSSKTLLVMGW